MKLIICDTSPFSSLVSFTKLSVSKAKKYDLCSCTVVSITIERRQTFVDVLRCFYSKHFDYRNQPFLFDTCRITVSHACWELFCYFRNKTFFFDRVSCFLFSFAKYIIYYSTLIRKVLNKYMLDLKLTWMVTIL